MNESAYGSLLSPSLPTAPFNLFPQSDFTEGVYIDYRAFDAQNITPRYEFGFGLSYTTFSYSNLQIECIACVSTQSIAEYPSGAILEGGMEDLWDVLVKVTATVENSGSVSGAEVAQLYLGIPEAPVRQLRGYSKETIAPGKRVTVEFDLTRRDLSVWDTTRQNWKLQSGTYAVYVGGSSRNLPLTKTLSI